MCDNQHECWFDGTKRYIWSAYKECGTYLDEYGIRCWHASYCGNEMCSVLRWWKCFVRTHHCACFTRHAGGQDQACVGLIYNPQSVIQTHRFIIIMLNLMLQNMLDHNLYWQTLFSYAKLSSDVSMNKSKCYILHAFYKFYGPDVQACNVLCSWLAFMLLFKTWYTPMLENIHNLRIQELEESMNSRLWIKLSFMSSLLFT